MLLDGYNQACLRDDVDDGGYVVQDLLDFRRNILVLYKEFHVFAVVQTYQYFDPVLLPVAEVVLVTAFAELFRKDVFGRNHINLADSSALQDSHRFGTGPGPELRFDPVPEFVDSLTILSLQTEV